MTWTGDLPPPLLHVEGVTVRGWRAAAVVSTRQGIVATPNYGSVHPGEAAGAELPGWVGGYDRAVTHSRPGEGGHLEWPVSMTSHRYYRS